MSTKGSGSKEESLTSRSAKITQFVLEKGNQDLPYRHLVSRDALLDALFLLYDECSSDYLRRNKNIAQFLEKYQAAITMLRQLQVNISDFEVRKIIGKGHFGEVHLVQEKQSGNIYAMKILRKSLTLEQQSVAFYEEERDIMMKGSGNPWITALQYSFQDARNLYLVMEFLPGGDMLSLLERNDNVLPEDVAQFYLAEIVLALHSLHSMGYVHRDIKPDNILIDRTGHIKLADFGSAAMLNEHKQVTSKMPVGTPDYIAPEVLTTMNKGAGPHYGVGCDWWSLGIVAYEMLFGITPFGDDKVLVTYANIMNYKEKLSFSDDIKVSDSAISIIKGLLQDAKTRLSYKELYDHDFFKGIDWMNIQKLVPPYVPAVSGQDDTSHFDDFELDSLSKRSFEPFNPKKEFSGKNLPFVGFTYSCCLSYVSDMYAGFNDTLNNLSSSGSFMRSSLTLPRNHGRSSSGSSKETQLKKQVVALEAMESSLKSEVSLLKSSIKRVQEQSALHSEEKEKVMGRLAELETEVNSLRHLLDLERKNCSNTERRAVELLRAIEHKYKKREQLFMEAAMHNCPTLSKQLNSGLHSLLYSSGSEIQECHLRASQSEFDFAKEEEETVHTDHQDCTIDLNDQVTRSFMILNDSQLGGSSSVSSANSSFMNGSREVTVIAKEPILSEGEWQEKLRKTEERCQQAEHQVAQLTAQLRSLSDEQEDALKEIKEECAQQVEALKKVISHLESSSLNQTIQVEEADLLMSQEMLESEKRKYEKLKETSMTKIQALEKEVADLKESKIQLEKWLSQQEAEFKNQLKNQEAAVVEQLSVANEVFQEQLSQLQIRTKEVDLALSQLENEDKLDQSLNASAAAGGHPLAPSNHLSFRTSSGTSNLSPEILHKMLSMEAVLHKIHETQVSENNQIWELKGKLWKCEKEMASKQVDIRIAEHEKREAQAALSKTQGVQQSLFERLSILEKQHSQCLQKEMCLKDQLALATQELSSKEEAWQGKVQRLTNEKQILEDRISSLREEKKSAKELEEQHARSEGQYQQLDKENERLKEKIERLEDEKQHLIGEAGVLQIELKNKTKNCQQLEKSVQGLKKASSTLEEMTKDLEKALEKHEKDLLLSKQGESVLQRELEKLRWELKASEENVLIERKRREEQELYLSEMKTAHTSEVQKFEDRVAVLEEELTTQLESVRKLSSQVFNLEKEYHTQMSIRRTLETKNASLEEEIIRIKEEASSHITTVAQLKRNGINLQESLETSENRLEEALWTIEQMHNESDSQKASFHQELVKQDAQLQQHAKLIDLLQQRLKEQTEKKKKVWLFGLSRGISGKENKGPTPTKSQVVEKKRDRGFRHYVEIKEAIPKMSAGCDSSTYGPPERTGSLNSVDRVSLTGSTSSEDSFRCPSGSMHIFYEITTPHSITCMVCSLHLPVGKPSIRCRGCQVVCHRKCKELVPRECTLLSSALHEASQGKSLNPADLNQLGGWVKVPRNRNAGWERRFIRLVASKQLWISDQEIPVDSLVSPPRNSLIWDLCPDDGVVTLSKSLNPGDLQYNTTDIHNMIKLTSWPNDQRMGSCRDQIIFFDEYEEKWRWCQALELPLMQHLKRNEKIISYSELKSSVILNLEKCPLEVTCCDHLTKQLLLLGSVQGLYLVDLSLPPQLALKGRIFPTSSSTSSSLSETLPHQQPFEVHKVIVAKRLGIVLIVVGSDRQVLSVPAADILQWSESSSGVIQESSLTPVGFLRGVHHIVVSQSHEISPVVLAACSTDTFYLLKWNSASRQFVIKQEVKLAQPCVALHISSQVCLFAADKVFVVDLKEPGTCVEEFLDSVNANALTLILNDILKRRSSPVAIFTSCSEVKDLQPKPIQEEYFLVTRDMGVLVNCLGQQDQQSQFSWALQPHSFAYLNSIAFGLDSQRIEVVQVDLNKPNLRGPWAFLELPQALFLGDCSDQESSLYVGAVSPSGNILEIFRLHVDSLLNRKIGEYPELERNTSIISTRSDAFSFTSSVEDVLDGANSSTC